MENLLKIFKALSDKNRMIMVKLLSERELCVCEITELLNLAASTVSKHLTVLKNAGLIVDRKEKRWVIYSINLKCIIDMKNIIEIVSRTLEDDEKVKEKILKIKSLNRNELCNLK
jgi:ArsR family transcriptional regulator